MKKISALIILIASIITACMFYLVFTGISLRSAPLIQPSIISGDYRNIATGLIHRLFHELQDAHYILWGVLPETKESKLILELVAEEYQKTFHQSIQIIDDTISSSSKKIRNCTKPCWLLISDTKAHQLERNNFIENFFVSPEESFITLTVVLFNRDAAVSTECETQKRLNLNCLISVSIREVRRKMKDLKQRYFFLRKYNENDFFLFIESNQII